MKKKNVILNLVIGFSAGITSGLFSTGGGLILVPAFMYLLKLNEVKSRATSIMCILPMVLITSFFYFKKNYINFEYGTLCAVGGIIGSFIGSKILNKMPRFILRISFIVFMIYIGVRFLVN